jgi:NAD(P)H-dependent FMN reductase
MITGPILVEVILATTREGRFGELVAPWVAERLNQYDGFQVEVTDLRDHRLPVFDGTSPASHPRQYSSTEVAELAATIDRADGFVIATGEYNHSYTAVLKNAMEWTYSEWARKPVAFVGWGSVGGARAIEQLRQVAVDFQMAPIRGAVHILPNTMQVIRETKDLSGFAELESRFATLAEDLRWWAIALKAAKQN